QAPPANGPVHPAAPAPSPASEGAAHRSWPSPADGLADALADDDWGGDFPSAIRPKAAPPPAGASTQTKTPTSGPSDLPADGAMPDDDPFIGAGAPPQAEKARAQRPPFVGKRVDISSLSLRKTTAPETPGDG